MPAEILERRAVAHRPRRKAERVLQDFVRVGTCYGVHRIETHSEAPRHRLADRGEIEQLPHQCRVVGDRIDHLDRHAADLDRGDCVKVDVGRLHRQPAVDSGGPGEDRLGHALRRRAAVGDVVFDAESSSGPPGLWLAERMRPPLAPYLRITQLAAGVERMPPRPTSTLS